MPLPVEVGIDGAPFPQNVILLTRSSKARADPARKGTMRIARRLAGIELVDDQGRAVRLGSLWADRPVVLVFIRHFG